MDATEGTATLRRVGAGVALGGPAVFALSPLVLAEIAVLLVLAAALATYVLERRRDASGLAQGLAAGALLVLLDRQLDVGATVARSAVATVAIGVGIVVATSLVDAGGLGAIGRD